MEGPHDHNFVIAQIAAAAAKRVARSAIDGLREDFVNMPSPPELSEHKQAIIDWCVAQKPVLLELAKNLSDAADQLP